MELGDTLEIFLSVYGVICYEWTTRVTRLESYCSCRGDFGFECDVAGP